MLEILALMALVKKIGSICNDKKRAAGGFKFLGVLLWFAGELLGFAIGASASGDIVGAYILAFMGALVGAGISIAIVSNLKEGDYIAGSTITGTSLSDDQNSGVASYEK